MIPMRERKLAYPHPIAVSQLDNSQNLASILMTAIRIFVCARIFAGKFRVPFLHRFCLRFNHVKIRENVTVS